MTAKNRTGLITKLHTSLKKHYKPAPAAPGRPLLEHVLYAALLEDAPVDLADEGFAKCEQEFFDWNEVRVTSVTELAEVLARFPSPPATAARLKRCLQSVFEAFYNFDIDYLKKENLGKAVAKFEAMSGVSPFVLSYVVQHGLGGHAVPVNSAAMHIMLKIGIVSDAEARSGKVPGLERAIPKSKAIEFSSMLHQAAVALQADGMDKTVWDVIRSVNKDAVASPPQAEKKRKTVKRPVAPAEPEKQAPGRAGAKGKADSASKESASKESGSVKGADAKSKGGKPAGATKTASTSKGADAGKAGGVASADKGSSAAKGVEASSPAAKASSKSSKTTPAAAKKDSSTIARTATPATDANKAAAKPSAGGKAASKKTVAAEPPASKKGSVKGTSKSDAAPSASKPAASKSASKKPTASSKPGSGSPKKPDAKKGAEAPAAGGSGNQKLTKRKPR
jgi:hypothetical protein